MSNSNGDGMGRVRELDGHTTELVDLSKGRETSDAKIFYSRCGLDIVEHLP
jgi:hypothetical protein